MRCLVIDDDHDTRALVERMLTRLGHRVTAVETGLEAVAALGAERFDVALVDLMLPDMSGSETLRTLRQVDGTMRLLVVSGRDDRHHVMEALMSGADGYIVKDELSARLAGALQEVIAGRSPLSAGPASILVKALSGRLPPSARSTPPEGTPQLSERPASEPSANRRRGTDPPPRDIDAEAGAQATPRRPGSEPGGGERVLGAIKLEKSEKPKG
jgi:CheY-like chemotaxis protein